MTIHYHCQFVVFQRIFHQQSPLRSSFVFYKNFVVDAGTDLLTDANAYKHLIIVANQIGRSRCIIIFALHHFLTQWQKTWKSCKKLISIHHPLETNGLHANTQRTICVHENWQYLLVPLIHPNQVLQARLDLTWWLPMISNCKMHAQN